MPLLTTDQVIERLNLQIDAGDTATRNAVNGFRETALAQASDYLRNQFNNTKISQISDDVMNNEVILPVVKEMFEREFGTRVQQQYDFPSVLQLTGAERSLEEYLENSGVTPGAAPQWTPLGAVGVGGLLGFYRYDSVLPLEAGQVNWNRLTRTLKVNSIDATGKDYQTDLAKIVADKIIRVIAEGKQVQGVVTSVSQADNGTTKDFSFVLSEDVQTNAVGTFTNGTTIHLRSDAFDADNDYYTAPLVYALALPSDPVIGQRVQVTATISNITAGLVKVGNTNVTSLDVGDVIEFTDAGYWSVLYQEPANAGGSVTRANVYAQAKDIIVGGTNITATDDDDAQTVTLAGQAGGGPDGIPDAPDNASTAKQYELNVPATSGDATWQETDESDGYYYYKSNFPNPETGYTNITKASGFVVNKPRIKTATKAPVAIGSDGIVTTLLHSVDSLTPDIGTNTKKDLPIFTKFYGDVEVTHSANITASNLVFVDWIEQRRTPSGGNTQRTIRAEVTGPHYYPANAPRIHEVPLGVFDSSISFTTDGASDVDIDIYFGSAAFHVTSTGIASAEAFLAALQNLTSGTNYPTPGAQVLTVVGNEDITVGFKLFSAGYDVAQWKGGARGEKGDKGDPGTGTTEEEVFDFSKEIITAGTGVTVTDDDDDNTITLAVNPFTSADETKLDGIETGAEKNPFNLVQFAGLDGDTETNVADGEVGFYDISGNEIADGVLANLSYIEISNAAAAFNADTTSPSTQFGYTNHTSLFQNHAEKGGALLVGISLRGDTYISYFTVGNVVKNTNSYTLNQLQVVQAKGYGNGTGRSWNFTISETGGVAAADVINLAGYLQNAEVDDADLSNDSRILLADRDYTTLGELFEHHDQHHTGLTALAGYEYKTGSQTPDAGDVAIASGICYIRPLSTAHEKLIKQIVRSEKTIRLEASSDRYKEFKATSTPGTLSGRLFFNIGSVVDVGTALTNGTSVSVAVESNIPAREDFADVAFSGDASDVDVASSGFDGNLATTDDTVQKVAQALDDLDIPDDAEFDLDDLSVFMTDSITRTMVSVLSASTGEAILTEDSNGNPQLSLDKDSDTDVISDVAAGDAFLIVLGTKRLLGKVSTSVQTDNDTATWTYTYELIAGRGVSVYGDLGTGSATIYFYRHNVVETGKAADVSVDASGFDGNLETTDDTVQKVAQKVDDLSTGGFTYTPIGYIRFRRTATGNTNVQGQAGTAITANGGEVDSDDIGIRSKHANATNIIGFRYRLFQNDTGTGTAYSQQILTDLSGASAAIITLDYGTGADDALHSTAPYYDLNVDINSNGIYINAMDYIRVNKNSSGTFSWYRVYIDVITI